MAGILVQCRWDARIAHSLQNLVSFSVSIWRAAFRMNHSGEHGGKNVLQPVPSCREFFDSHIFSFPKLSNRCTLSVL